jgi:predicted  nucleic acid-binding Zn-ribbon protein
MGDAQRINRISNKIREINATIEALKEQKYDLQFEMRDSEGEEFFEFIQEIAEIDQAIWDLKVEKNRLTNILQLPNI